MLQNFFFPGLLSAIDETMEELFMRFLKGTGGLFEILDNCKGYQC